MYVSPSKVMKVIIETMITALMAMFLLLNSKPSPVFRVELAVF